MPQDPALALPRAMSPVETIETDAPDRKSEEGVALCLSGGGYRAMLFHTGALWRLNELGYLPRLSQVFSVSGGSIVAGTLARAWPDLEVSDGVAANFTAAVVTPIRALADRTIDGWVV